MLIICAVYQRNGGYFPVGVYHTFSQNHCYAIFCLRRFFGDFRLVFLNVMFFAAVDQCFFDQFDWRGRGNQFVRGDWTVGCIAVTDSEIEDIYAMVPNGTPIVIYP